MCFLFLLFALTASDEATTQIKTSAEGPVRHSEIYLNVTNVATHKKFWIDALGGVPARVGTLDGVRFPGVIIVLNLQPPTGGTKGTSVNHFGFQVPNVHLTVEKLRAAGYPIITTDEVTSVKPEDVKDDVAYIPNQDANVAFTMGPDQTKVELFENKSAQVPIAMHHFHFASDKAAAVRDWYIRLFGAKPERHGAYDTAELPGVSLRWAVATTAPAGTRGRTLDHIGFEVVGLERFCEKLASMGVKFDRPYSKSTSSDPASAFLTDPSGTYIELTEGIVK